MTANDLFSGIGGFALAAHWAHVAWNALAVLDLMIGNSEVKK